MWKKSLLALLVISPLALATGEKPKLQTLSENQIAEKIALAKQAWQADSDKVASLRQQQRNSFFALENLLNGATKQKTLSEETIRLAQGLIDSLKGYPLAQEAHWALLKAKIDTNQASEADIARFNEQFPNSAYQTRLAQLPFEQLYRQQDYDKLLAYSKKVLPESVQNQCRILGASYQLLAEKINANPEAEQASGTQNSSVFVMDDLLQQFEKLWLISPALPNECANLEAYWKDQGGRTEEKIRLKAVNLAEKNAKEALQGLISSEKSPLNDWLNSVVGLLNDPKNLADFVQNQEANAENKRLAQLIFPKWLKTVPEEEGKPNFTQIQTWAEKLGLNEAEWREWRIAYLGRVFDNPAAEVAKWRDAQIEALKADNLTERRIRMALWQQTETAKWLALLSDEGKEKLEWRYWAAKNEQNAEKRRALLMELTKARGFYPMLAAQKLGQPYQLPLEMIPNLTAKDLQQFQPEFARIAELRALNRFAAAKSAWIRFLKPLSKEQQLAVIDYAHQQQWYDLSVEGTIQIKAFDHLSLRLPNAYSDWFDIALKGKPVSKTFAQAIARQESAWNEQVKSHANAMGLMQLLPSTAEKTAKDNGLPYANDADLYQPFNNIMLGTAHLAELNQQYPNNRALIAAAYNAGAGRVNQWLTRSDNKLEFDAFVASIPFFETRGYVQNVLAYDYYNQILQGEKSPKMFYQAEWERKY